MNEESKEIKGNANPGWLAREQGKWRRFELVTTDINQIYALHSILDRLKLSRYELAVILLSLRVRSEFDLEDFDMRKPDDQDSQPGFPSR